MYRQFDEGTLTRGADGALYLLRPGSCVRVEDEFKEECPNALHNQDTAGVEHTDCLSARMLVDPGDLESGRMLVDPGDGESAKMLINPGDELSAKMLVDPGDGAAGRMLVDPGDQGSARMLIEPGNSTVN